VTPTANNSGTPAGFNGGQVTVLGQNNITLAVTSVSAQMSDFGITAFPSNISVAAGQTATYQVALHPNPVYGTNVSLSCSNVPTSASCNFTPGSSISLQGSSPASATLNLTTTPQTILTASSKSGWRGFYAVFLGIPGLTLVGLGIGGGRRRRWRVAGLFVLLVVVAQLLPLPGCSTVQTQPPPTGTPSGQYSITLTATSGTDSKSIPIQLTVTPSP
jgi:trimeric autotransporter adhesin